MVVTPLWSLKENRMRSLLLMLCACGPGETDETNEPGPTKRTQETAIREWQESVGCAGLGLSRQDSAGDDEPDGAELPAEKRTRVDA